MNKTRGGRLRRGQVADIPTVSTKNERDFKDLTHRFRLLFAWFDGVAGMIPKDFITSVFTAGVETGEEENGAEASSIKTTDPVR